MELTFEQERLVDADGMARLRLEVRLAGASYSELNAALIPKAQAVLEALELPASVGSGNGLEGDNPRVYLLLTAMDADVLTQQAEQVKQGLCLYENEIEQAIEASRAQEETPSSDHWLQRVKSCAAGALWR